MTSSFTQKLGQFAPALFVFLWSTGFIGARMGAPYSEPMTFLTIRFVIVLVLLIPIAFFLKAKWPSAREAFHAFIAGLLLHGLYLAGVFWAIDDGMPAGLTALVMGLQPVLTAFFAAFILKEIISRNHVFGFILGMIGISLVLYPRLQGGEFSVTPAQIGASLVAVLSIALGSVYQKRFASNLDMRTSTVWQYLAATLFTGALALTTETQVLDWTSELYFALGWLVLVLSIGAIFLLLFLIEQGAVSNIAGLFYMIPAVTAVLSWILFDEPITLIQVIGIVITGTGVFLASHAKMTNVRNKSSH
jgi:drug/metabolite transporter (DMT)-like permease